jgi:membrane protease YdiL (CAAX protease family)
VTNTFSLIWEAYNSLLRRLPVWLGFLIAATIWGMVMTLPFYLRFGSDIWPVTPIAILGMWTSTMIYYRVSARESLGRPPRAHPAIKR